MLPGANESYRIIRSADFHSNWSAGVAAGWLNPIVHPAQAEYFINSVLPTMPLYGRPAAGQPPNFRTFHFPHSPRGSGVIEIVYSIIEDDRTIILETIRLIA